MTNNDTTLQLSSVLNRECTRSRVHCQSKKRALEIISELAAKQLSLPPQVVFEAILTREKMGSTGIGNGIAIPHGKLEEDTLRAVGVFVQLETPIAFDAIETNRWTYFLPCWCRQTKLKRTCILCRWWRNVWRTKPSAAVYAQPRAMKSCIKSLRIPKVLRMKRSYSVMSLLDVVRRNSTWY